MKFKKLEAVSLKVCSLAVLMLAAPALWAQQDDHAGHDMTAQGHSGHGSDIVTRAGDAAAQSGDGPGSAGMMGQGGGMNHGGGMGMGMGQRGGMMHGGGMNHGQNAAAAPLGQDAFAAVQAIVLQLEADPNTDWSQVNIDALRTHLIDMNLVTLYAQVSSEEIDGGARYTVIGEGDVLASIQRMVPAHAAQMDADPAWSASTENVRNGVILTVRATASAATAKVRALGFMGFMVQGDHHQSHHQMMATGVEAHAHQH